MDGETKTLEDTIEIMHSFWKSYVVELNFDLNDFEKCYFKEINAVKEAFETLENNYI